MPTLLVRIDVRRRALTAPVPAGPQYLAGAERKFHGSLVGLVNLGRLTRDIGLGVLSGVGIGVFVAMIGDLV